MRFHASLIDRSRLRLVPLGLALGVLLAVFSGLAASPLALARPNDTPGVAIVSPASASGPVQTSVRVTGAGWNAGASVQLYYYSSSAATPPCGDPATSQTLASQNPIVGSTVTVKSDGTWFLDFQWPSTSGMGQFSICAFDTTMPMLVTPSTQLFSVLSTTLPSIDMVMPSTPNVGDQITVHGTGFLPANQTIDLKLAMPGNESQAVALGTTTSDGSGNFSQMVTLPTTLSGNLELIASTRPAVSGALPPEVAIFQNLIVGTTASTATPGPTSTATATPIATATTPATATTGSGGGSGSSGTILDVLIFLLALVILAIFGVLIWYFAGIRPPAGAAAAGMAPVAASPRVTGAPRRGQVGRPSQPEWPSDEWEDQQAPWEEDEQGGWGGPATQWDDGAGRRPPGPAAPPRPPSSRPPNRDGWQGRSRPGEDGQ